MIDRSGRAVSAHNYALIAGRLPECRQRIYDAFRAFWPQSATGNEIIIWLKEHDLDDNDLDSKGTLARISELTAAGLLKVTGTVEDPFSGVQCRQYCWVDEKDATPIAFKKPTRKQLEAQVAHLQEKLARQRHKTQRAAALLLIKLHTLECRLMGR